MYYSVTAVYKKKITFLRASHWCKAFWTRTIRSPLGSTPEPKHLRQSATQHVESVCVDLSFNCLSAVAISDIEWLQHCRCRNISDIAGRHSSLCQLFWHTQTQLSFLSCFFQMPQYDFLDYVHQFGVVSFLLSFLPLVPPSGSSFNIRSVLTLTSGPVLLEDEGRCGSM